MIVTRIFRIAFLVIAFFNALLFSAAAAVMILAVIDLPIIGLTPGVAMTVATSGVLSFFWVKFFVGQMLVNEFSDEFNEFKEFKNDFKGTE